ncbi:hypothetical protein PR202_ga19813 [Eleusine coracana subsp. coracana]|uniref:DUF1618 domain-containing protein n=1 Tax=Eleusine coracana subsp. coracana TaxID=191504 RepID=A0AAV5CWT4_ELECO|nr:hypothetical protein PR202_ga19813 [Eleusine coracana subsp. coracana]
MAANLQAMKPDPQALEPPEINHLSMVQETVVGLLGGSISCTDKALVVLYAGSSSTGCYLVYDASDSSLNAIPQLPDSRTVRGLGIGAAILSLSNGSYVIAELAGARSKFPDAELFLWWSPSHSQNQAAGQWIRRAVRLPPDVFSPGYFFRIDMAFTYADSNVCWVDLLKGVLLCNLTEESSPEPSFTYVPLPTGCSIEFDRRRRPRSQLTRAMGCCNGSIKFVALVGSRESCTGEDMVLTTWTLSPDLKEWKEGTRQRVRDLWDSESFVDRGLPRVTPSSPVVSIDEADVVYVVLNEIDRVDAVDKFGVRGVNMVHKEPLKCHNFDMDEFAHYELMFDVHATYSFLLGRIRSKERAWSKRKADKTCK